MIIRKKPIMLLEVLIAFAIIVLCALPLLAPHFYMLKAQREFLNKVQLDHDVNLLYGEVLQRLYLNRIPWTDLQKSSFPIDADILQRAGIDPNKFRYQGSYRFSELKCKPKRDAPYSVGLYQLTFSFAPKRSIGKTPPKPMEYEYKVFVVHNEAEAGKKT